MSDHRYTLLQEIDTSRYDLFSPIEIETGALLYDSKTNKVLLQLHLNILGIDDHRFSAVNLRIDCFDEVGDPVAGFNPYYHTFTKLNTFGIYSIENEIPIILDPRVRRVEVALEKATYTDGSEWFPSGQFVIPPAQKRVNTLNLEMRDQVNRDIHFYLPDENRDRIVYIPMQMDHYWLCACGRPNLNSEVNCCRCGLSRKWAFRNLSETGIQLNLERHQETIKEIQDEERFVKERRIIRKKNFIFQLQRGFLAFLSLGLFLIIFFFFGSPYIQYVHAKNLLKNAAYDEAISIYENLGDFKDSVEMIKEAHYQKAFSYLADRKFDEALALFAEIKEYRDSSEMITEVNYQKANDLLAKKSYAEAASLFTGLKNYRNSKELAREAYYQKGKKLLEQNNFEAAAAAFDFSLDYKDSNKLYNKANFLWGLQLMGRNEWHAAQIVFSKVDKNLYPEVLVLAEDAKKRIDKEESEKKDKKDKK